MVQNIVFKIMLKPNDDNIDKHIQQEIIFSSL